jgi:protein subunit release factor B
VTKELLFSVTASDCEWSYTRGTGKGGQKKNKTSSAVHCFHRPSGAHGFAQDSRKQVENKRSAFVRMAATAEFQAWHRVESARRTGALIEIEEIVDREMQHVVVEVQNSGRWVGEQ